jgi:hypothetical protein
MITESSSGRLRLFHTSSVETVQRDGDGETSHLGYPVAREDG